MSPVPLNERITEGIARRALESGAAQAKAAVWEQIPDNERVRKCLRHASKAAGSGRPGKKPGRGRPEFIVAFDEHQDFLIVVECKADIAAHDDNGGGPAASAVGGALHYARHLSREFNVLAIAVSGTQKSLLRVSHFWHYQGDENPEPSFGADLLRLDDYLEGYFASPRVVGQDLEKMLLFTKDLNGRLHKLQIRAPHRSLLISAVLMALRDRGFVKGYRSWSSPSRLLDNIKGAMLHGMRETLRPETHEAIAASYGFMDAPGRLAEGRTLVDLVSEIDERVNAFRRTHEYHDLLGRLYVEFLRYSNSDKGLGIVLTPPHMTQLAADLADAGPGDVLYDNCAGTGGFLVSGMKRMLEAAKGDRRKEAKVRERGLVGIEYQPDIAALLSTNMFIHGDGRSNVFRDDCFSAEVQAEVRDKFKPTVGFLNPPFKSSTGLRDEMEFALTNMESLRPGGRCLALMPMQCVLAADGGRLALKKKIMERHTLEAVLSLPDELFHNSKVGVVTCLAIFTAHRPHPSGKKTWFALCKDDGFMMKKPLGRCDPAGRWREIGEMWVRRYRNLERVAGFSTTREVAAEDEWCAEAHIDADYSGLPLVGIPAALREYATFIAGREIDRRLSAASGDAGEYALTSAPASRKNVPLPPVSEWGNFALPDLFRVSGTKTTPLETLRAIGPGPHPYVTTQATNNGVEGHFARFTETGGVITVDSAVVGFSSYQADNFSASDHVEKLTPKFPLNAHLAMFLTASLNANRFRYSYGRKASQARLRQMTIKLPALANGKPDFALMERHVRTLPFSSAI